jgi:membrane associated rhomboid family serine protease
MSQQNKIVKQQTYIEFSLIPILVGAGIALFVISFFVFGVDNPKPEWGKYWMIRPLIITPLAGAMGGVFYLLMDYQGKKGFNRPFAIALSIVVYLIGLWLGTVLGLAGTMWD